MVSSPYPNPQQTPRSMPVIKTMAQPDRPLQITKRTFAWPRYRMQMVDDGQKVWAWLSPEARPDETAYVITDSTTTGMIRGARLSINPFIVPERLMGTVQTRRALESYVKCTNNLIQAVLCVENTPFPTNLGTFIGVEMEDSRDGMGSTPGLRVFGPKLVVQSFEMGNLVRSSTEEQERTQEEWKQAEKNAREVGQDISHLREASKTNKTPVEICLPCSSQFRISLDVGYGFECYMDKEVLTQGAHVWEGTLTLVVENNTMLGAIGR